jgi:hypothetical protein
MPVIGEYRKKGGVGRYALALRAGTLAKGRTPLEYTSNLAFIRRLRSDCAVSIARLFLYLGNNGEFSR